MEKMHICYGTYTYIVQSCIITFILACYLISNSQTPLVQWVNVKQLFDCLVLVCSKLFWVGHNAEMVRRCLYADHPF